MSADDQNLRSSRVRGVRALPPSERPHHVAWAFNRTVSGRVVVDIEKVTSSRIKISLTLPADRAVEAHRHCLDHISHPTASNMCFFGYEADVDLRRLAHEIWDRIGEQYHGLLSHDCAQITLRKALMRNRRLSHEDLKRVLSRLALTGWEAFANLFRVPLTDDRNVPISRGDPELLQAIQQLVRDTFNRPRDIVVRSFEPLFPWAFLYGRSFDPDRKDDALDPETFWGFRHALQELVPHVSTSTRLCSKIRAKFAICSVSDNVHHHDSITSIAPQTTHWVRAKEDLKQELQRFDGDLFYFYGHGDQGSNPTQNTSFLRCDRRTFRLASLLDGRVEVRSKPAFFFLNCCASGRLAEWSDRTFPGFLCHRTENRVTCLTVAERIPRSVAAFFAREFFSGFLGERLTAGLAVRRARRRLLATTGNPLGLLYTLFAHPDLSVH